jgi:hypothetical protein
MKIGKQTQGQRTDLLATIAKRLDVTLATIAKVTHNTRNDILLKIGKLNLGKNQYSTLSIVDKEAHTIFFNILLT